MRQRSSLLSLALAAMFVCDASLIAQTSAAVNAAPNFSYNGDLGPGFWNEINPACATTPVSRQSPINIDGAIEDAGLEPLHLLLPKTKYRLTNKGYTVEAPPEVPGVLMLEGVAYTLLQFHFHALSEHTVDGRRGEMEMHAVFRNEQKELAVIGVLFKIGQPNAFLQKIIDAGIPQKTGEVGREIERLNLREGFTDTSSYYTYSGSLTTPNCSENVRWIVLKRWAEMSPEEFEAFRHVLGNDFRPLQKRNNREIHATLR